MVNDHYLDAAIYAVLQVYSDLNISVTGRLFFETIRGEVAKRWMLREDDLLRAIEHLVENGLLALVEDTEGDLLELKLAGSKRIRALRPPRNWREVKQKSQTFWTVAKINKRGRSVSAPGDLAVRRRNSDGAAND